MRWIDGHCDVLWRMWEDPQKKFYQKHTGLDVTYDYLLQVKMKLQIFSIFIPPSVPQGRRCKEALKQIDLYYQQIIGDQKKMVPLQKIEEIDGLAEHQCGAMLALEGAEALEGDLSLLRIFHQLGVKQIGLTWNRANEVADGILEKRGGGLTAFGHELLNEMRRLHMVVDVSHLSQAGFWDVMKYDSLPIVASHSNCSAVCPHVRNLTDDQIRALIKRKGLIGINFVPYFIDEEKPDLTKIFDHIDHLLNLGGEHVLFFGSDFDGEVKKIPQLENLGHLNHFKNELLKRYREESVLNWGFYNGYRFYREHLR